MHLIRSATIIPITSTFQDIKTSLQENDLRVKDSSTVYPSFQNRNSPAVLFKDTIASLKTHPEIKSLENNSYFTASTLLNLGIFAIISGICLCAFKNYATALFKPIFPSKNRHHIQYASIGAPYVRIETQKSEKSSDKDRLDTSRKPKKDLNSISKVLSWSERQREFERLKNLSLACDNDDPNLKTLLKEIGTLITESNFFDFTQDNYLKIRENILSADEIINYEQSGEGHLLKANLSLVAAMPQEKQDFLKSVLRFYNECAKRANSTLKSNFTLTHLAKWIIPDNFPISNRLVCQELDDNQIRMEALVNALTEENIFDDEQALFDSTDALPPIQESSEEPDAENFASEWTLLTNAGE